MSTQRSGFLDGFQKGVAHGWAWDPACPDARVTVDVYEGTSLVATAVADRFRPDLRDFGIGDGAHSFAIELPAELLRKGGFLLNFRCRSPRFELMASPFWYEKLRTDSEGLETQHLLIVDPDNLAGLRKMNKRWRIKLLLAEPISACNAECVYCPHLRSGDRLDLFEFKAFLEQQVGHVERLQFGCGHEPTAHSGLLQFFEMVDGLAKKPDLISMVTNGTLLHRHNMKRFVDLGLRRLQISIDSADPELQAQQRPGTDFHRIIQNTRWFRDLAPEVSVEFNVVVTRQTLAGVPDLIDLGLTLGVSAFNVREVTHRGLVEPRQKGFHERLPELTLEPGVFQQLKASLEERYPSVGLFFLNADGNLRSTPIRALGPQVPVEW